MTDTDSMNKTVFAVDAVDGIFFGVFSTLEKAQECCQRHSGYRARITECTLDHDAGTNARTVYYV